MTQFIAVVESYPDADHTTDFRIECMDAEPFALMYLEYGYAPFDGIYLARVGRYLELGNRWKYVVVDPVNVTPTEHRTAGRHSADRMRSDDAS